MITQMLHIITLKGMAEGIFSLGGSSALLVLLIIHHSECVDVHAHSGVYV